MKKILLATTILAASAGFASAEITWSGSATMGVATNGADYGADGIWGTLDDGVGDQNPDLSPDNTWQSYSSVELSVALSGETDGGLSFGASTAISAGRTYDLADDDGFDNNGGTLDNPEVYISGSFGKVSMKHDGYGFFHNDDDGVDLGDVKYTGSFGAISVGVVTDVEAADDLSGNDSNNSLNLGYSANNITAGLNFDDNGEYDVSLGYTMGAITATVTHDESYDKSVMPNVLEQTNSLKLAYSNNGISGSVKFSDDSTWEVAAGYSANSMTVNVSTDDVSAWSIDASYDLGGGLSVNAGTNYTGDAMVGAAMAF